MDDVLRPADQAGAGLAACSAASSTLAPMGTYRVQCHDLYGRLVWEAEAPNLVVNTGKNDLLNKYFLGAAYTAAFYVGLKLVGGAVAGDTMASHASWAETAVYSNATRPAFTPASSTVQSSTNSASPAVFTINGTASVAGLFITTSNTVSGTAGTLFSVADFGAARAVLNGDTLSVTYTLSV